MFLRCVHCVGRVSAVFPTVLTCPTKFPRCFRLDEKTLEVCLSPSGFLTVSGPIMFSIMCHVCALLLPPLLPSCSCSFHCVPFPPQFPPFLGALFPTFLLECFGRFFPTFVSHIGSHKAFKCVPQCPRPQCFPPRFQLRPHFFLLVDSVPQDVRFPKKRNQLELVFFVVPTVVFLLSFLTVCHNVSNIDWQSPRRQVYHPLCFLHNVSMRLPTCFKRTGPFSSPRWGVGTVTISGEQHISLCSLRLSLVGSVSHFDTRRTWCF